MANLANSQVVRRQQRLRPGTPRAPPADGASGQLLPGAEGGADHAPGAAEGETAISGDLGSLVTWPWFNGRSSGSKNGGTLVHRPEKWALYMVGTSNLGSIPIDWF